MINLIRMDLYRMRKARSFWVCLVLCFVSALSQMPLTWALGQLGRLFGEGNFALTASTTLSSLLNDPLPMLNTMLCLLSAGAFFYADMENGYIKNIAGQVPKRGLTVLSKFMAILPHNLLFMLVGLVGGILSALIFTPIRLDGQELTALRNFVLRFLLLQSLSTILLFTASALRSKSLTSVLAVLLGTGVMLVVYSGITLGLGQAINLHGFDLGDYMPDQLLGNPGQNVLRSLLSAGVTGALFLLLAIRVFDRRDVK